MSHRELGVKILRRLTEELADIGDIEVAPKMEGYQMFTILSPKKGRIVAKPAPATKKEEEPEKPKKAEKKIEPKAEANLEPKDPDEIF
jgi:translation initiation factor IF-3